MNGMVTDRVKSSRFYSADELSLIDPRRIPRHIAIIPDGNRRWARQRLASADFGHKHGADVVMDTVEAAKDLGIRVVTIYTFSTENWSRPKLEVHALMTLINSYLRDQCSRMVQEGVRFGTIGELSFLPKGLQKTIAEVKTATASNTDIDLVLALNYGSRDELRRAVVKIAEDVKLGVLAPEAITEDLLSKALDTAPWGDPDLLIRSSGELRISNFMLWQLSYAEMHTLPVLWPDFSPAHLLQAVLEYKSRDRRSGG